MKRKPKSKLVKKIGFFLLFLLIFLMVGILVVSAGAVYYIETTTEAHLDISQYDFGESVSGSTLYYYDFSDRANRIGEPQVLTTISASGVGGGYVTYDMLPQDLIDAFVAIEDKRFWTHDGVDWRRTVSAAANYFLKFQGTFGASTITQQLIKNITGKDDQTPLRKLQEARWALDLEQQMDKREILEMYVNIINLGQGCFGVQNAAQTYFSKDVDELTLLECACIASITKNPAKYNPITHPEDNQERRDVVLTQMWEQGYISEEEYRENYEAELVLHVDQNAMKDEIHSWYVDMVIEDVIDDLSEIYDCSTGAASMMLYYGGLQIYTAIDTDIQKIQILTLLL